MERQLAFISSRKLSLTKLLMVVIPVMIAKILISTYLRIKINLRRDLKFVMVKERHLWCAQNLVKWRNLEKELPMSTLLHQTQQSTGVKCSICTLDFVSFEKLKELKEL